MYGEYVAICAVVRATGVARVSSSAAGAARADDRLSTRAAADSASMASRGPESARRVLRRALGRPNHLVRALYRQRISKDTSHRDQWLHFAEVFRARRCSAIALRTRSCDRRRDCSKHSCTRADECNDELVPSSNRARNQVFQSSAGACLEAPAGNPLRSRPGTLATSPLTTEVRTDASLARVHSCRSARHLKLDNE